MSTLHRLFDEDWYRARHPEVVESGIEPMAHYLERGDAAGYWPHPLFDPEFYSDQHPELSREHGERLEHYLTEGEEQGSWPNPLFDPIYYRRSHSDLSEINDPLLAHYASSGGQEGRSPCLLFAAGWYRKQYPEVAASGLDPLSHYLGYGDAADLSPHPLFDSVHYGEQHPELERLRGSRLHHFLENGGRDGTDPHPLFHSTFYGEQRRELRDGTENLLVHYLTWGEAQGLKPNPLFDPAYYRKDLPTPIGDAVSLLGHYAGHGGHDGRNPCLLFDSRWVLSQKPASAASEENPLAYYFRAGATADANPHPLFDVKWYREQHPEVASSAIEALLHFLTIGAKRDFDPHPLFDSAWYRDHYSGHLRDDEPPFLHYLRWGESLGCQPNPFFDAEYYRRHYRIDIAPPETTLSHFVRHVLKEKHRPAPIFDYCVQFFRQARSELRARGKNPANGYFEGEFAGLSCPDEEIEIELPRSPDPLVSIVIPVYGQLVYTLACLRSISRAETRTSFEVVVVDDHSPDDDYEAVSRIENLTVIRNETNLGYLRSCNRGAAEARGREIVFLNNDTIVTDGWLDQLLETRAVFPRAGLVGSSLLFPNGRLQEAGSIVWNDGSAVNYGYGEDPENPAYSFARKTDYVSAAAVLISADLFEELNGFDEIYSPAFYEDTDLAFRVRDAGWDVVCQPASTVIHFAGATHGRDPSHGLKHYQKVNQSTFFDRWSRHLEEHPSPDSDRETAATRLGGRRALVLDSCMLTPDQDSGSLRMFNLIRTLRGIGFTVTFVPSDLSNPTRYVRLLQENGVQVLCEPHCVSIEDFLEKSGASFDVCILSRPDTAKKWLEPVKLLCPRATVLYDTVDLHFLRRERELAVSGTSNEPASIREDELRASRRADGVITVSEFDRVRLLEEVPGAPVHVVSNIHEIRPTSIPFAEREGILFIGGFRHTPNVDAVIWFVREVLPFVHQRLPDVCVHVVGGNVPREVSELANARVVIEGHVEDIEKHFAMRRLSVAPLRYGSGVKGKVNQSMAHGLPCVATPIAVEGIDAKWGSEILVAAEAEAFAEQVTSLYESELLWMDLSRNSIQSIERTFSVEVAEQNLKELLDFHGVIEQAPLFQE
ncbi:MAG: glycosyltransferase [Myxococcales bacterium]|nr:glycosyltransferase [Myxococcales bacterium]